MRQDSLKLQAPVLLMMEQLGKPIWAADGQKTGAAGQTAGISENKTELTTESAPAMETRDETVYVKATTLNLRVSPAPGAEAVAAPANGTALKRTEITEPGVG